MAAQVPYKKVRIEVSEVPGAQLPNADISTNSVEVLKRFLVVRGVKIKSRAKKQDLVKLVETCLNANVDPSVDRGKWLDRKVLAERRLNINIAAARYNDFGYLPVVGWKPFPSITIPEKFSDSTIYKHVIQTAVIMDEENVPPDNSDEDESANVISFATGKSLTRGRRYFLDGHIQRSAMFNCKSSNNHYCLKGRVRASMNDAEYPVTVVLHTESADVIDASCDCKASGMSRCAHVCGLLIALQDYALRYGFTPPACTSQLCSWNQGRKEKSSHASYENQYNNKRDPARAISHKMLGNVEGHQQTNFLKYIGERQHRDNGWSTLLSYKNKDYTLTPDHEANLKVLSGRLLDSLKFGFTHPACIPGTNEQAGSEKWLRLRRILITASKFTDFLVDSDKFQDKVNRLMWEPKNMSNRFTDYGIANEEKARHIYQQSTGRVVTPTGLWINPSHPGLAASPDGIVMCPQTNTIGLLEIKCTYVLKDHLPTDIHKLNPQQKSAYCLKQEPNNYFCLKKTHKWYKQIQMQLGITGYDWCDFCLWTEKGIFIQRVEVDQAFWQTVAKRLSQIYWTHICPEYFENRLPRGLPLIIQQTLESEQPGNLG